jgi:hypothetical protein
VEPTLSVPPYVVDRTAVAAETGAILCHPGFGEALTLYTAAGLDRFDGDLRTAKMVCQVARYVLGLAILHLDATAGPDGIGATATRLDTILRAGGFASAGWVKGAIHVLRRTGYLDSGPPPADQRMQRVVPSVMMMEIATEAMTPMLKAVDRVAPLPLPAEALAGIPGFIGAAASHTIVPYLTDGFNPLEALPEIVTLLHHDFGFVVLCCLIRSMRQTGDGAIIAAAPSVELSRRFGMSRAQARNLVQVCRDAGWITSTDRGAHELTLSPAFADLCWRWVAHDLACWSRVARASARDLGLGTARHRRGRQD